MQRITGPDLDAVRPYFEEAATLAREAACLRAKCGSVVVANGEVIGRGFNGPALGDEANRMCETSLDLSIKPKYDRTCCVHAEWRAILNALRHHGDKTAGATLYFMRVDDAGAWTGAGDPFCTTCSRLTLESGIGTFALWNAGGADIYEAAEYNHKSYEYFRPADVGL